MVWISQKRAADIVQKERVSGEGGVFERRLEREALELRHRRMADENSD